MARTTDPSTQAPETMPPGPPPPVIVYPRSGQSNRVSANFDLQIDGLVSWQLTSSLGNGVPGNITFSIWQDNPGSDSQPISGVHPRWVTEGTVGKQGMCYAGSLTYWDRVSGKTYDRGDVLTFPNVEQFVLNVQAPQS